jgi:hypothetical protein
MHVFSAVLQRVLQDSFRYAQLDCRCGETEIKDLKSLEEVKEV